MKHTLRSKFHVDVDCLDVFTLVNFNFMILGRFVRGFVANRLRKQITHLIPAILEFFEKKKGVGSFAFRQPPPPCFNLSLTGNLSVDNKMY